MSEKMLMPEPVMEEEVMLPDNGNKLKDSLESKNGGSENDEKHSYEALKDKATTLLESWDKAYSEYRRLESDRETYSDDLIRAKMNSYDGRASVLAHDMDSFFGIRERQDTVFDGDALLARLAKDESFEGKKELAKFLAYRLWFTSNRTGHNADLSGEENPRYEAYRMRILPFLKDSMTTLAISGEQKDLEALRETLDHLASTREQDIATSVISQEEIDAETRLRLAVETMNVFGVVPTIEVLLAEADDNSDVLETVKTIQGENGARVMTTLSAVYQSVEFRDYALNNGELTTVEAERVRSIVENYARRKGIPPEQVHVADIGAGTGRHSILLQEQGLDVTAYEYEGKHVQQIKEDAPDLRVVQADWYNMPLPKASEDTPDSPEVMFCLGRTILHNNTPEKMTRFFDEMHRVLQDGGVGLIDIPEVPEVKDEGDDEYSRNIREYSHHLESLGVLPQTARNIYDGPDASHRYNRMAMTQFQFESYAKLFGFKVEKIDTVPVGEKGLFDNSYYKIEKDPDFDIADVPDDVLSDMLNAVGLHHSGVDYNRFIDTWGVPLGTPWVFGSAFGSSIDYVRERCAEGSPPLIRVDMHDDTMVFRMSY